MTFTTKTRVASHKGITGLHTCVHLPIYPCMYYIYSMRECHSLFLSLSLTQTHTDSLTLSLPLAHTHTHTFSLSLTLSHTFSLSPLQFTIYHSPAYSPHPIASIMVYLLTLISLLCCIFLLLFFSRDFWKKKIFPVISHRFHTLPTSSPTRLCTSPSCLHIQMDTFHNSTSTISQNHGIMILFRFPLRSSYPSRLSHPSLWSLRHTRKCHRCWSSQDCCIVWRYFVHGLLREK